MTLSEMRAQRQRNREAENQRQRLRADGRARWMEARGVTRRHGATHWAPTMRFWRRVFRLRDVSPRGWNTCLAWDSAFTQDHPEVFVRDGHEVALVSMFYGRTGDAHTAGLEETWREMALRFGLRFERDDAASWHMPSGTVLFVLWIPGEGSHEA